MREFMVLVGQIFLISCVQTLIEVFVDPDKKPLQAKITSIACFCGSLYLLLQFVLTYLLREFSTVLTYPF